MLCVVCVVQMMKNAPCLARVAPKMHLIRVAEHLGASSRRPRHPALDVQVDGVRKRPVNRAKKPFLTATAIK